MKKVVLSLLSFISIGAIAQSFTVNDTLSAGDSQTFYTADSTATNYDGVTGTGVTWDYSNLMMYNNTTNLDTIQYASDSPNAGDYPLADYNDDISQGTSSFFSNTPDSVVSYGYIFNVDGNEAKVMYDVDPLKYMAIPMTQGDSYADSVKGTAEVFGNSATILGEATVSADGTGTLELGASTFTNILRVKLEESLDATIDLGMFGTASGTVTRVVYSYYDLANDKLPVFVHATINVNSNLFQGDFIAVYSSVALPIFGASVEEEQLSDISIYPNPANDFVTIALADQVDQLVVMNALGQTVHQLTKPQAKTEINTSEYETGIYFIQIQKGDAVKTQKLVIK